ncbi:MAG: CSLREA domain-containing protein [Acidobacteriota bacterium]|nr:MAG: CSLREA domain-containing protein [Acidobacteriota bacterium]
MRATQPAISFTASLILLLLALFILSEPRLWTVDSASAKSATIFTTITVDTAADDEIVNGNCTLREAIIAADSDSAVDACAAGSGTDIIAFAIPGAGPHTIAPTSFLPIITEPVIIDGTTQPGASCTTSGGLKIEINGANTDGVSGLILTGGNSIVRGLVINRFTIDGIALPVLGGNTISCN